jgi:hypothetical protein
MGFDLHDIFDIGTIFNNGQPIMHVFTDLIVILEEHTPDEITTPINLIVIMDEEESKVKQIFTVDSDDGANLDETLSIDHIVCTTCNRQCTLEDQEDG